MNLTADFTPQTPVVANVGVWDPFLPDHARMFTDLSAAAKARGHTPCALILDPPAAWFIAGPAGCPAFDDITTRIRKIRECGVEVAVIEFEQGDLKAGVAEFLDLVGSWCTLSLLWLGSRQSLGSGPRGSSEALRIQALQRRIELYRMPAPKPQPAGSYTKMFLAQGRVRAASALLGRVPVRHRTPSPEVPTSWLAGSYHALMTRGGILAQEPATIGMQACGTGPVSFTWPAPDVESLIFISGPGDGIPVPQTTAGAGLL